MATDQVATFGIGFYGNKLCGERIDQLQCLIGADQLSSITRTKTDHHKLAARLLRGNKPVHDLEPPFAVLVTIGL